jgi:hypothetical protein
MLQANLAKARAAMAVKALLAFIKALLAAFYIIIDNEEMQADLAKARAAIAAASAGRQAEIDVRSKGGGAGLDEALAKEQVHLNSALIEP